jgi:putative transposase
VSEAYDSVDQARASLNRYIHFYSGHRPYSNLDGRTPDQAYFDSPPFRAAA